jgi:integrase
VGVITAAQAREKAMEVLSNINKGIEPTPQKGINIPKTLQEFIENEYKPWVLAHHKRGGKTIASIIHCFNKLFSKSLTEITPVILEQWRSKRVNDGISNATINRDIGTLKSAMTKAAEWGYIKENPLKNLKLFKVDRAPKVRYLSVEEETRLRQVLLDCESLLIDSRKSGNHWRKERGYSLLPEIREEESFDYLMPMVLISINTGLHQGELFNLAWDMIDLSEESIIISGGIKIIILVIFL